MWHQPKALQAVPFCKFEQPCYAVNARQQLVAWPVAPLQKGGEESRPTGIAPCHALHKCIVIHNTQTKDVLKSPQARLGEKLCRSAPYTLIKTAVAKPLHAVVDQSNKKV